MITNKSIIQLSNEILDLLIDLRSKLSFNFGLRVKGNRLKQGLWFQGTEHYVSIGLSSLGAGNLATQSISLLIDTETKNFGLSLIIEYPANSPEDLKVIYEGIAKRLQMNSNQKLYYKKYNFSDNILENIEFFFENEYPILHSIIVEKNGSKLLIDDQKFERNLSRIQIEKSLIINDSSLNSSKRYWKFAPGENAIRWNDFKLTNTMQIAYPELSEEVIKSASTKEELRASLNLPTSSKKLQNLNNFIFEGQEGDIVFANKGRSTIVGVGIISGSYKCIEDPQQYNHSRMVDWIADKEWSYIPNSIENYPVLFAMDTFSETPNGPWILNEYLKTYPEYRHKFNNITNAEMTKTTPINQILYGPPGTGKTHRLKTDFFPKYTTKETAITPEQHFEEIVRELTWWQVIAIAVIEYGKCKVGDLMKHKWVIQKAKLSNSNTVRPTLWGQLQSHTVESCEFVNVKSKQQPFIFNKTADSYWEILEEEVKEFAPELYDIMGSVNNFQPNPEKEIKRYVFTTFHQSFNYEDFIEGIKPVLNNEQESEELKYRIEDGIFKELCNRAESDPNNQYAIFIDEINRGNVSAIFGELITLIETDKRKDGEHPMSANLPYSKKPFTVPSNVDIIGTMNTADRSVEALDTALRRRFSFVEMLPQSELLSPSAMITRLFWKYEKRDWEDPQYKQKETVLREFLKIPENETWDKRKNIWDDEMKNGDRNRLTYLDALNGHAKFNLQLLLSTINNRIEALVDRDHTIGHAYFMKVDSVQSLQETFAKNIIPLLQEYFYGNYAKMEMVIGPYFFENNSKSSKILFAVLHDEFTDYNKRNYQLHDISKMTESDFMDAIKRLLDPKFSKEKASEMFEQDPLNN